MAFATVVNDQINCIPASLNACVGGTGPPDFSERVGCARLA